MTKRLVKALKLAEQEKNVPMDDALILDWMDEKVDLLKKVQDLYAESPERLDLGELNEETGDYQVEIDTCAWRKNAINEVHIYNGIEYLAKVAGAELQVSPYTEDRFCHYFMYRDVEFFELSIREDALAKE